VPGDVSQSPYLNPGLTSSVADPMLRFGWWANTVSGSPYRVGEYENWTSGPFVDIDGLWSDACRTLDLSATLTDDSSGSVHGYYYGPGTSGGSGAGFAARFDYEAFPHNLGHDPMSNMATVPYPTPTPAPNFPAETIVKQDMNAGQDYAIQVQEFKANFKGQLTDNVRWRLDVFDIEKDGVRQATALSQCFVGHPQVTLAGGRVCHDFTQAQTINWATTEVTPKLEGNWGALTVEYSHPIRIFSANDSTVQRTYEGSSGSSLPLAYSGGATPTPSAPWSYGVVDNNITNIDQVKIGLNLDDDNKIYALMLNGITLNDSIGTDRYFNNVDVRWTNTSIENLTLTTFWKQINESETLVSQANAIANNVGEDYYFLNAHPGPNPYNQYYGDPATNQDTGRHSEDVGLSALWRPFGRGFGLGGLAIHANYDYQILHRDDAIFVSPGSVVPAVPVPGTAYLEQSEIDETYTRTNNFEIRPTVRWSPCFDTYFKYRLTLVDQPLIGVKNANGTYDTLLPQQDNLAEIGATWLPTKQIVCNATLGIEQAYTNIPNPVGTVTALPGQTTAPTPGGPINFGENSYPYSFSVAYTPTCNWTLTGGYANYTNFISQLITLGDTYDYPGAPASTIPPIQTRWGYLGEAEVFDLGATYRWSKDVKLTAAAQYSHGIDTITTVGSPPAIYGNNLAAIPEFSRVIVDTMRVEAGIDWQVREHLNTFFRYQYYSFNDPTQVLTVPTVGGGSYSVPYNTGIANGFLVGLNWVH
jgi:hypothetical protein